MGLGLAPPSFLLRLLKCSRRLAGWRSALLQGATAWCIAAFCESLAVALEPAKRCGHLAGSIACVGGMAYEAPLILRASRMP